MHARLHVDLQYVYRFYKRVMENVLAVECAVIKHAGVGERGVGDHGIRPVFARCRGKYNLSTRYCGILKVTVL